MYISATLTSKGQVTMPKEVRHFLNLTTGDTVIFRIDDKLNTVTLEKAKNDSMCQACDGKGAIYGLPCPICNGQAKISRDISVWDELGMLVMQGFRQGIKVEIQEKAGTPLVRLNSPNYPKEVLEHLENYLNFKLKEAKSNENPL